MNAFKCNYSSVKWYNHKTHQFGRDKHTLLQCKCALPKSSFECSVFLNCGDGCQKRRITSLWLYIWHSDASGEERHFLFSLISHVKILISHVQAKILIWPVRKSLWARRPHDRQSGAVNIAVTSRCDYYIFSRSSFGNVVSLLRSLSACWRWLVEGKKLQ